MIAPRAVAALAATSVVVIGLAGEPRAGGPEAQAAALADELRACPGTTAADVYKLLHQGVFGPGHAIRDRASAERYLAEETAALRANGARHVLCQPLGGPTPMARIHLRPYLAAGYEPAALVDAFIASAAKPSGSAADMDRAVETATGWLGEEGRRDLADRLRELSAELAVEGYPAIHHSGGYTAACSPAYRVVRLDLAIANGWCP